MKDFNMSKLSLSFLIASALMVGNFTNVYAFDGADSGTDSPSDATSSDATSSDATSSDATSSDASVDPQSQLKDLEDQINAAEKEKADLIKQSDEKIAELKKQKASVAAAAKNAIEEAIKKEKLREIQEKKDDATRMAQLKKDLNEANLAARGLPSVTKTMTQSKPSNSASSRLNKNSASARKNSKPTTY
jgi:predicted transcriptional regulator